MIPDQVPEILDLKKLERECEKGAVAWRGGAIIDFFAARILFQKDAGDQNKEQQGKNDGSARSKEKEYMDGGRKFKVKTGGTSTA